MGVVDRLVHFSPLTKLNRWQNRRLGPNKLAFMDSSSSQPMKWGCLAQIVIAFQTSDIAYCL